jgi:nicotinate-nucleotide adenylyltransferase
MKWGLFGGTFNPVHFGHLRAAEELMTLLDLERVIFIPAASPPHKTERGMASFEHRLQMMQGAIAGNDFFSLSDVEGRRPGKSYSIDTVQYFLDSHDPGLELYFITGQDAFDAITTWQEWDKLLSLCHFAVITRPGYENKGLLQILPPDTAARYVYDEGNDIFKNPQGRSVFFRRTTFLDISSSHIREKIQQGQSVRYMNPDKVVRYIEANQLYR